MKTNTCLDNPKVSSFISNFFNPIFSLIFYFVLYSAYNSSLKEASVRFAGLLLLAIVPVTGWIIWNVKRGSYTNMDVSDQRQRRSLYPIITAALLLYLFVSYFQTQNVDTPVVGLLVLLLLLQASNYFVKSSMHTALNVYTSALMFEVKWYWGLIWLIITFLVAISRLILQRHSVKEVLSGAGIATAISVLYLFLK